MLDFAIEASPRDPVDDLLICCAFDADNIVVCSLTRVHAKIFGSVLSVLLEDFLYESIGLGG